MALNAIETHEEICKWIESSINEKQLDVLTLFVTDTFSKRFPPEVNKLHTQFIEHMLHKIEAKRIREKVGQRFPVTDEIEELDGNITYTQPVSNH